MNSGFIARRSWLILLLILVLAATLRFYDLEGVPPGFQFDEAYNASDAMRILNGERPLFLEANGGREVLYTYVQSLSLALWGRRVLALRLVSAAIGCLTIGFVFLLVRTWFVERQTSSGRALSYGKATALALLTSALMAITYWHLHFSRYGIRAISLPLLEVLLFYAFWRGLQTKRLVWWLLAGALLGLGPYTHPAGRLLPFIPMAFAGYLFFADREGFATALRQLLVMGAVSLLIFVPLGRYFWLHPDAFAGHASLVSAFNPQVSTGNPFTLLLYNVLAVVGMFALRGDGAWNHNLSGRPVFDLAAAACFGVGVAAVVVSLIRKRSPAASDEVGADCAPWPSRDACVFLVIWTAVMLSPTVLSSGAPDFSRSIGAVPAVLVFPSLGLLLIGRWLEARHRFLGVAALAVVLTYSAYATLNDYFYWFPKTPDLYHIYDVDKIEAVKQLRTWAEDSQVYLSPLWSEHATVSFLTTGLGLKSFDSGETLVLPSRAAGKDAVYVFSWEQTPYIDSFSERMGALAERIDVPNSAGGALLVAFRVRADDLPEPSDPLGSLAERGFQALPAGEATSRLPVRFGDGITLLGYSLPESLAAGGAGPVTLFWQATGRIRDDYTVFLHVTDDRGRRWGQDDRRPNQGGYPTVAWDTGDVIIDRYWPAVDPCAPSRPMTLSVGLYNLKTQERLTVEESGLDAVALGRADVVPPKQLALRGRKPTHALGHDFGQMRFLGTDGLPDEVAPGDILSANLYWQAQEELGQDHAWRLAFRHTDRTQTGKDWESANLVPPVPTSRWAKGDGLCSHHDVVLPPDLAPGTYDVALSVPELSDDEVRLGKVRVAGVARSFDLPDVQYPLFTRSSSGGAEGGIQIGSGVRLLGYDLPKTLGEAAQPIPLTLYWQALGKVPTDYKTFVHLLDDQETVRSQVDVMPMAGARPTSGWLVGEVLTDTITLPLSADLKPGKYRLELGMYQPVTGQRLPVLDPTGQRLPGDRFLLEQSIQVEP